MLSDKSRSRALWWSIWGTLLIASCRPASVDLSMRRVISPPSFSDTDGDGVSDAEDRCPGALEDGVAPQNNDGCAAPASPAPPPAPPPTPPPAPARTQVTDDRIAIQEEILFESGSATIAEASSKLVEEIGAVMKSHPEIDFIEIAGHTDAQGSQAQNVKLSQERAGSVMKALAQAGVDSSRMRAAGYGPHCPVDTAETEAAHAKNRRVEFRILRRSGADLAGAKGGCPAAEKKGIPHRPIPASAPRTTPRKDSKP